MADIETYRTINTQWQGAKALRLKLQKDVEAGKATQMTLDYVRANEQRFNDEQIAMRKELVAQGILEPRRI